MKCSLTLEDADLEQMLNVYFTTLGFQIKELDMLKAQFLAAYPDGIVVEVAPLNQIPTSPRITDSETAAVPDTDAVPNHTISDADQRLSLAELTSDPFKNESLEDLLKESERLKKLDSERRSK